MAILFMEGWDHAASGSSYLLRNKWTASRNGNIDLITGRFGNAWWGFNSRWTSKDFPTTYTTWIAGCAVSGFGSDNREFLNFSEQGLGSAHVSLWFDTSVNVLKLMRGTSSGTVLDSYAWLPGAGFHYIEMAATVDNAAGAAEVRIDGSTVMSVSGVDTRNGGAGVFNRLILGDGNQGGATPAVIIDDLYLLDDSGGSPTDDFLGDCRVECLFPSGNGNSSQFIGSDADTTDNYLLVDEISPDDDTTYVESGTVSEKDTYAYGNLAVTSGTVYGVQILPHVRKTDAGLRKFCSVTRLSGTEVDSADQTLSTSYQYFPIIQEAKPGGGVWTISDINSAEFGAKVTT